MSKAGKRSTWASPEARGSFKNKGLTVKERSSMVSFAQMREAERVAEAATIGPGSFDGNNHQFGWGMNKVGMGSKYKDTKNTNPGPGEYDVVSPTRHTKERKYEAMIFKYDDKERKKPGEGSPEPG